jgi:hypothetical protein
MLSNETFDLEKEAPQYMYTSVTDITFNKIHYWKSITANTYDLLVMLELKK